MEDAGSLEWTRVIQLKGLENETGFHSTLQGRAGRSLIKQTAQQMWHATGMA